MPHACFAARFKEFHKTARFNEERAREYAVGYGRRDHCKRSARLLTFFRECDPLMSSFSPKADGQEGEQGEASPRIAPICQPDLLLDAAGYVVSHAEAWCAH